MTCPNCGGDLIGDGYTVIFHCENADEEDYWYSEPDAGPIYCRETDEITEEDENE